MWVVWGDWSGLLDGYRLACAFEEELRRKLGKTLRKAELQARILSEQDHARELEKWIQAREGQLQRREAELKEWARLHTEGVESELPDGLRAQQIVGQVGAVRREQAMRSRLSLERLDEVQEAARKEGISDRNGRIWSTVLLTVMIIVACSPMGCGALALASSGDEGVGPLGDILLACSGVGLLGLALGAGVYGLVKPMGRSQEKIRGRSAALRRFVLEPIGCGGEGVAYGRGNGPRWGMTAPAAPSLPALADPPPLPIRKANGIGLEVDVLDRWKERISEPSSELPAAGQSNVNGVAAGYEAERELLRYMHYALGEDYVGIPGLMVGTSLDVDLLLIGPTGIWVLESKYWSGEIRIHRGTWTRRRYANNGDASEEIPAFDEQWLRQREAVLEALSGLDLPVKNGLVKGGLVFSHPRSEVVDDGSCRVLMGGMLEWKERILGADLIEGLDEDARVKMADALLAQSARPAGSGTRRAVDLARKVHEEVGARIKECLGQLAREQAQPGVE